MIEKSRCCICDNIIFPGFDFCQSCYSKYNTDILGKVPWVKEVKNSAQRERRRKKKEQNWVRL